MKKIVAVLAVSLVAGVASADIAIALNNGIVAGWVEEAGAPGSYVDQALVQLIWSPVDTAQAEVGGALGTGEFLLNSLTTTSGWRGTWGDQPQGTIVYGNFAVGGVNINAGYFFVRIFDTMKTGLDDWYLQQYVQGPVLNDSTDEPPPTPYNTSGFVGGTTLDDATYGHQVIPEPAVAGLIGIFGAGMIMARRIFNRAA